jgi:hypothetical protein
MRPSWRNFALWLSLITCWLFGGQASVSASPKPQEAGHHLVRRAEIALTVTDVEQSGTELDQLAHLVHGHFERDRIQMIILEDGQRELTAQIKLPPEFMDTALARLRGMATTILHEQIENQDVSSQLSELQDHLERLRAHRRQLRDLLEQADTSGERQEVQTQLSNVEADIAEGEAALADLQQQLDWATIDIHFYPAPATPTPSPIPSPIETAQPAPVTPGPPDDTGERWRPGETARRASRTLIWLVQILTDALIAVAIVGGPFLIFALLGLWVLRRFSR